MNISRLDRLFLLLSSGSDPSVRRLAARKIGEVQKSNPTQLYHLLAKVSGLLRNEVWETRIGASQALETLLKEVPSWQALQTPNATSLHVKDEFDEGDYLRIGDFDLDRLLRSGASLLGSAQDRYQPLVDNSADQLTIQRQLINQRLGMNLPPGVNLDTQLITDEDLKAEEMSVKETNAGDLVTNQMLRGKKRRSSCSAEVSDAKRAATHDLGLFHLDECQEWPFRRLAEQLLIDLFDAAWEKRHGAALGLKELMKSHGQTAGHVLSFSSEALHHRNQIWLEDVFVRVFSVILLDRFGDFVSDEVVAPVRETCAQVVAIVTVLAEKRRRQSVVHLVLRLLGNESWEIRHGGLLCFKYLLAASQEVADDYFSQIVPVVVGCLNDADDDVRATAAGVLLLVVDKLGQLSDDASMRLTGCVLNALYELDDLTPSTDAVLSLLAGIIKEERFLPNFRREDLQSLIPKLWPFLRHRKAALSTLVSLVPRLVSEGLVSEEVMSNSLRLVFQACIAERDESVLDSIESAWNSLLDGYPLDQLVPIALTWLAAWMCMAMQPVRVAIDHALWLTVSFPKGSQKNTENHVADSEALKEFIGGMSPSQFSMDEADLLSLPTRLVATRLLANLCTRILEGVDSVSAEPVLSGLHSLLTFYLNNKSAVQRMLASLMMLHWQKKGLNLATQEIADRIDVILNDNIYFDEVGTAFTQMQAAARCFVRLLEACVPSFVCNQSGIFLPDQCVSLCHLDAVRERVPSSKMAPLEEHRNKLLTITTETSNLQEKLQRRVKALCACWLVSCEKPPEKMNPIIRPLMECVKKEKSLCLQKVACGGLAKLLRLCAARNPSPNEKVLKNLIGYLCCDENETPQSDSFPSDCIVTVRRVERSALVKRRKTSIEEQPAADPGDGDNDVPSQRRGSVLALRAIVAEMRGEIPSLLPSLIGCLILPARVFNGEASVDEREVVCCLQLLEETISFLDDSLQQEVLSFMEQLLLGAAHSSSVVRHMVARSCAAVACTALHRTLSVVLKFCLEGVEASHDDAKRMGCIEILLWLVRRLDTSILPYVEVLLVPVLGRMSDQHEQVRLAAAQCFAALIPLLPLEGSVPDPPDFEWTWKREHQRQFLRQLMNPANIEHFDIPLTINATLRSYQQEGVNWLHFLRQFNLHGILCDDMGLGKTLQTICILASEHHAQKLKGDSPPLLSLVVCPSILTRHWQLEVEKFVDASQFRSIVYAGNVNQRKGLQTYFTTEDVDLVITSYEIVRNDIQYLSSRMWNYCVLDEGHVIKSGKSKLAQAISQLRSCHRLILSGTPVQNSPTELWCLFDFLMPGLLGTEQQFQAKYGKVIAASRDAKGGLKNVQEATLALEALHRQVLPFLLRRMKSDVLQDLPEKIIQDYFCDLSPLQTQLYEDFAQNQARKLQGLEDEAGDNKVHIFQALHYLKKVCNHPILVLNSKHPLYERVKQQTKKEGSSMDEVKQSGKLSALRQLLIDCGFTAESDQVVKPHRALVFCQTKAMIDLIEELLHKSLSSVTYLRLDGSVPAAERFNIVTQFNSDPSIDLLLLTTSVGGVGLNLTGADTVIFVEHDWNPVKDLQAMDRAHRIGQKRTVNVYRLICRGTVEEKMMNVQNFKLQVANSIINNENASLQSMDCSNVLDLFALGNDQNAQSLKPSLADPKKGSLSALLASMGDLWDESQYEGFQVDQFFSSLGNFGRK